MQVELNKSMDAFHDAMNNAYFIEVLDLFNSSGYSEGTWCLRNFTVGLKGLELPPPFLKLIDERISKHYQHIFSYYGGNYMFPVVFAEAVLNRFKTQDGGFSMGEGGLGIFLDEICPKDPLQVAKNTLKKFQTYHRSFKSTCPNDLVINELMAIASETVAKEPTVESIERLFTAMHVCILDGKTLISDAARTIFVYECLQFKGKPSRLPEQELVKAPYSLLRVHQECRTPFARTMKTVARLALDALMKKNFSLREVPMVPINNVNI